MIEPKNILIIRTDRIGDLVLTLPVAAEIKKKYPNCKITFLIRKYTEPLVKENKFIDDFILLDENQNEISALQLSKKIKNYKFDSVILVHPKFKLALAIFIAGIKNRISTGYRWYSFLFNHKIYEHRKFAEKHELEYNINLLKPFGIENDVNKKNVEFNLIPDEKSVQKIEQWLNKNNINREIPIVIIHPGSGGSAIDLPISKFRELVELLVQNLKIIVLITGSESEKELCQNLVVSKTVINAAGEFDLNGLIALINYAEVFAANSTGPIHIAAALGKFVIGFYPKIVACSPERWGPYTEKSFIFMPDLDCKNCTREQCEKLNCMNTIDVNEVYEKIKNLIY